MVGRFRNSKVALLAIGTMLHLSAHAQFEPLQGMTQQIDMLKFCGQFKGPDRNNCINVAQARVDELYKVQQAEMQRSKRGGPHEDCFGTRSRSEYCQNQRATERENREAQQASAAAEKQRTAEENQRQRNAEATARQAKNAERAAALKACEQTRESKLYQAASAIFVNRQAIEVSELLIEKEKSIGKRTGVVNQQQLYEAGRVIEESKTWIAIMMPQYKALGGSEREIKSLASRNPCDS